MKPEHLSELLVSEKQTIREIVTRLDKTGIGVILIVDAEGRLIGTVTDGDVRRAMLNNITFESSCDLICNHNPIYVTSDYEPEEVRRLFDHNPKKCSVNHIPILSSEKKVLNLLLRRDFMNEPEKENPVFIMAGGLGSRLSPLTENCPKPLLQVSEKPVLEILLENFIDEGFSQFYIAVNYKGKMIEEMIGDGARWGVSIQYLYEDKRLGTAGPLSLLSELPDAPFFVMNADILTKVCFQRLLDFHRMTHADVTVCVREHEYIVPYGVVELSDHRLVDIEEKPVHNFYVNTGIYVLSPSVLEYVPKNTYFDMNTFLKMLLSSSKVVNSFPVHEYWLDIGRIEDLERAHREYQHIFQS